MAEPLLIAHRGASGARPEHTLEAYELAARWGADYLEPDLVATADGQLVARHENEISATTDIAERAEFADRRGTKVIDGVEVAGWFTEDLTLAELRTLRCRERLPALRPDNTAYDGQFTVPTLGEILDLRSRLSEELGRKIGLYPETKHPTYFRGIGLPLEEPLVAALTAAGLNRRDAPVFVQSFELGNLIALRRDLGLAVPTIFLAAEEGAPYDLESSGDPRTFADLLTPAGLAELARWVSGIGPHKDLVIGRSEDGSLAGPTPLVARAHAAGLAVHPWTFRRENEFLPTDLRQGTDPGAAGDVVAEIRAHLAAGVDGFFTDHPDLGVLARG
ncbi:glycerophosphodiester phosphodiesterase [Ornithinimicrobium ciconiae]|uniref:glycerophosphodiester phosphodiesterase n=1 Tax=Ornithinimicrobium ciconiae TaxID=2594265 RepID=UPI001D182741|nr:glycerophosphodiester phosphodiesterase [Ornithinimicrobium ciconiae]